MKYGLSEYYKEKYQDVLLYTMQNNRNGTLPVHIRKVNSKNGQSPRHRHEVFQINYITSGRVYHEINESRYELGKGHIFVIPPYVPHMLVPADEAGYSLIELEFLPEFIFEPLSFDEERDTAVFDFAFVEPFLVAEQDVKPRLLLTGQKQQQVEEILESIWKGYTGRLDSFLLEIKADLLKLLVILGRYFREETNRNSNHHSHPIEVMRVIRYLDEHYKEKITVDELAKIANLSRSYFSCIFKDTTGKTLIEYITSLRLKHAAEMLCNSNWSISEICYESGFDSINHFNRVFKKEYGCSPLQYRKNYL